LKHLERIVVVFGKPMREKVKWEWPKWEWPKWESPCARRSLGVWHAQPLVLVQMWPGSALARSPGADVAGLSISMRRG
jgi:hypothetical protein